MEADASGYFQNAARGEIAMPKAVVVVTNEAVLVGAAGR
jgi:hypothetical protein